ncbi:MULTISPECIES: alpha/beta hydrolase [unclassified Streptomyces]|uniref:alpha/beta fold hydrolase n=1 Tax=unclassified Streptomyces TaxID=2593676 RepID=UPI003441D138
MAREFTVAAADTHLHGVDHGVDTLGGKPPLLFLNGGFATQRQWNHVIGRLGGTYRAVTFDARGRGRSGTSSDYSLRGAIDDVDRVIEATALRRPILVSWSHGATIALCYAADYPEMVSGLVLVDGAYPVSVFDAAGKEGVRERFRGLGWITRVLAFFGRSARLTPQESAEVVIGIDEVNGDLGPDFEGLGCPTVFVVGSGAHSGASAQEMSTIRAAAARAAATNDRVTVFATTMSNHARILAEDPGVVAAAIEDVAGRSMSAGATGP